MSLSTYADLKSAVATWLNRTDLTAQIPDFIALAEAQMNKRLRVRQMLSRAETDAASEFVGLPADFLAPVQLTLELSESDIRYLSQRAPERLLAEKAQLGPTTGEPRLYAVTGSELQLLPAPDTSYRIELVYYAKLPALSDANTTNWLLTAYPDAYLYGALTQAPAFLVEPEQFMAWGQLFLTALTDCQKANRVPGGVLRTDLPKGAGAAFDIATGV